MQKYFFIDLVLSMIRRQISSLYRKIYTCILKEENHSNNIYDISLLYIKVSFYSNYQYYVVRYYVTGDNIYSVILPINPL